MIHILPFTVWYQVPISDIIYIRNWFLGSTSMRLADYHVGGVFRSVIDLTSFLQSCYLNSTVNDQWQFTPCKTTTWTVWNRLTSQGQWTFRLCVKDHWTFLPGLMIHTMGTHLRELWLSHQVNTGIPRHRAGGTPSV